ncbi:MAG: hypothetical protein H8E82_06400 [Candidatus Marinimicrobia bacterium]|nr:hypothetical protein [Candidatus Neomarinimicrobiota bacterium]
MYQELWVREGLLNQKGCEECRRGLWLGKMYSSKKRLPHSGDINRFAGKKICWRENLHFEFCQRCRNQRDEYDLLALDHGYWTIFRFLFLTT